MAVPARADTIGDKQREAKTIADRIERLGDRAASLGEAYNGALIDLQHAQDDVAQATQKLAGIQQQITSLRSTLGAFAVRAYIYADQTSTPVALLSGADTNEGIAQREGYVRVALGADLGAADQLGALAQDATREQDVLQARQDDLARQVKYVADRKKAAEDAEADQKVQLKKVNADLAVLVAQEQQRRREAAEQADAAAPGEAAAAIASAAASSFAGFDLPPTSPGAAIAVRAALSQLGVPYRFNAASPGVAFDCSGLTMWAWAQAGVSMAHYTVSQWRAFPKVPLTLEALRPGDLIFSYGFGHVGMYIGNGLLVAAPRTGDVVRVSPVFGIRPLSGAVRP
jgi:cell wall-associated NlpC family hydrolase